VGGLNGKIANLWAVNDGEKVRRDDLRNPHRAANSVWDGERVRIFAARNETVAFQLIVESGPGGIDELSVAMSPLVHVSEPHCRIENEEERPDDPNHYVGRRIEVLTQHYLYVPPELSTPPQWFYAPNARPKQMSGWIPDALIPGDARKGFGGQPVQVLPFSNQGFWIDIYIPDDERLKAGIYKGHATVRTSDGERIVPVELELFDFTLPHENHADTMVYVSDVSEYFPGLERPMDALRKMAHRHRFDVVGADVHVSRFDEAAMERYRPYLNGEFFRPVNGYEGPGQGVGERIFPIGMYGAPVLGDDPAEIRAESDKWVAWFEKENWPGTYFLYLIDEPRPDKFAWINERAAIIKSGSGPGRKLPILTTRTYTADIEKSIDIWCASKISPEEKANGDRNGQPFWFYNGYRPSHGSVILEGDAVDLRVNGWMKWRSGIGTYFLWHGTHWRHNSQGPRGRTHQNVYGYPVTFMYVSKQADAFYGGEGVHWGNGDGILFYPGREPFFREQDRGIEAPFSSIRMKNLRRGIQDYEYIWLAAQIGKRAEAEAIVREALPKAMFETDMNEPPLWSPSGNDWDEYRRKLALLIAGGTAAT
jgi:hypothetical protein